MKKEYDLNKLGEGKVGRVLEPSKTKVVKTVRLDGDVVRWLVAQADEEGLPYQTLMNSILRRAMKQETLEERKSCSFWKES